MVLMSTVLKRGVVLVTLVGLTFGTASMALAAVGAWTLTGSMTTPRGYHTATLLNSGQVLVAGGDSARPGPVVFAWAAAELYDPASGTWSLTDSMALARTRHRATLLQDGRVLVSGGYDENNNVLASLEIFDPLTSSWTPAGSVATARTNHTATLLLDGRVLLAGGQDASKRATATAELYDPSTGASTPTSSMAYPRSSHTETLLNDGTVLVTGGGAGAEVYDPTTGTWSRTEPMVLDRVYHTATLLNDGRVLVTGGDFSINGGTGFTNTAELYSPPSRTWTATTSMNFERDGHRAVLLNDGTVLVVGSAYDGGYINAEVYDPATAVWTLAPNLNAGRARGHSATLLTTGQVLVAGGAADATSAELYTSTTPTASASLASAGRTSSGAGAIASVTAQYDGSTKRLHIRAVSTDHHARLTVILPSTGQVLGTLAHNHGHTYTGTVVSPLPPGNITIRSNRGDSLTVKVAAR